MSYLHNRKSEEDKILKDDTVKSHTYTLCRGANTQIYQNFP